jgi:hypothetical protein
MLRVLQQGYIDKLLKEIIYLIVNKNRHCDVTDSRIPGTEYLS